MSGDRLSDQQGERYRIEDLLGSGGFGIAYRATDLRDGKEVAIKVLQSRVAASPESAELFAREAEAAQQVTHKNIARTLAYVSLGTSGIGVPYIVIEYIAGGNLAEHIAAQNNVHFDQDVVIDWMMQLAEGLQAVHEHVLHRDLKPQNILVDGNTLKICDFGMSKYIEESTRTLTLKAGGTYAYMPPEVWQKQSTTKATDIYSLGIMFYQIATTHLPFTAYDLAGWRQAHLFTAVPRPSSLRTDLDGRLDGIIIRMLSKRATDRFQSAGEIISILKQIASSPLSDSSATAIDPVVRAARQTFDKHRALQAQQSALEEEKRDSLLAVNYQVRELAARLDGLVREKNKWLPESPISIEKVGPGTFVDASTGEMTSYGYLGKSLVFGFLRLLPQDLLIEYDPIPGYDPPGRTKRMAKREVTVDGSSIVVIGYLKQETNKAVQEETVTFPHLISKSPEHGIHFLLLRTQGELYGTWKTCELDQHPMYHQPLIQSQVLLPSARDVIEALDSRTGAAPHIVKLRDFSDSDFISLLEKVVSS